MSHYANQLAALNAAVIDCDFAAAMPHVASTHALSADARLRIYRDSYCERLLKVTLADYPATAHAMGEEALTQHVQHYVLQHISGHWDINHYGHGLPVFMQKARVDAAYVALAQLEAAINHVFWLPDSAPMTTADGKQMDLAALAETPLRPRKAHHFLALSVDALAYLEAFRAGDVPKLMDKKTTHIAVWRHENQVQRTEITREEYVLLQHMQAQPNFGTALEASIAIGLFTPDTLMAALPGFMSRWLQAGLIASPHA